jgi:hypothetical protein
MYAWLNISATSTRMLASTTEAGVAHVDLADDDHSVLKATCKSQHPIRDRTKQIAEAKMMMPET